MAEQTRTKLEADQRMQLERMHHEAEMSRLAAEERAREREDKAARQREKREFQAKLERDRQEFQAQLERDRQAATMEMCKQFSAVLGQVEKK